MEEKIESKTPRPLFVALIIASAAFTAVALFKMEPFIDYYNLHDLGTLGDAVNGLSAPVISFCSVILIYITFREQNKSNLIQRRALEKQEKANQGLAQQWEFETLERMFSEIVHEFNQISYTPSNSNPTFRLTSTGTEALEEFFTYLKAGEHNRHHKIPILSDLTFILLSMQTFLRRLNSAQINAQTRVDFYGRIHALFNLRMGNVLAKIIQLIVEKERSGQTLETWPYEKSVIMATQDDVNSAGMIMNNLIDQFQLTNKKVGFTTWDGSPEQPK